MLFGISDYRSKDPRLRRERNGLITVFSSIFYLVGKVDISSVWLGRSSHYCLKSQTILAPVVNILRGPQSQSSCEVRSLGSIFLVYLKDLKLFFRKTSFVNKILCDPYV